ncbi:MAG: hypothetical protein IIC74_12560 [Bacteroidetes bacterium]|nr:hypothetical protein [Bacteroidota bacterium]
MKKPVLFLLGIAIGIGVSYFYFNREEVAPAKVIVKPKGLITPAQAKVLDRAYNPRFEVLSGFLSDTITMRKDNRSSWYSLKDMRDYLNYAENQAESLGYTMNGVRIYLGAHPSVNGKRGLTTMFLIPTGTKLTSNGSMLSFTLTEDGDIFGGDGLNKGDPGDPPDANYPQQ